MSSFARRALSGLVSLCVSAACYAASSAIGLIVANGSFQLDHSSIRGTATLLDGNVVETNSSSLQVQLNGGVNLRLAADSRARVYGSRLALEKGIGELESGNYRIEAAGLRIETAGVGRARVQLTGPARVLVAADKGDVQVSNGGGVLVARLSSGHEMIFEPQEAGATVTKISGILALKDGKFIVVDRVTNVTMQVQGQGLEAEVGHLVEITGTVGTGGAYGSRGIPIDRRYKREAADQRRTRGRCRRPERARPEQAPRRERQRADFPPAPLWRSWVESPRPVRSGDWRRRTTCRARAAASLVPAGKKKNIVGRAFSLWRPLWPPCGYVLPAALAACEAAAGKVPAPQK